MIPVNKIVCDDTLDKFSGTNSIGHMLYDTFSLAKGLTPMRHNANASDLDSP